MPGKAKQIRRGISPKQLRRAFDRCLDPANPLHANLRAALEKINNIQKRALEQAHGEGLNAEYEERAGVYLKELSAKHERRRRAPKITLPRTREAMRTG